MWQLTDRKRETGKIMTPVWNHTYNKREEEKKIMKNRMRKLLVTGLVTAMAASAVACGSSAETTPKTTAESTTEAATTAAAETSSEATSEETASGELTPVTMYAIKDPQMSAAYYIALDQGYFEEEGLDLTTEVVSSGPDLASYVAKGSNVYAMGTTYNLFAWLENDVPMKAVMPVCNIGGTQDCAIREGLEITEDNVSELEGLTVGMVPGAEAYLPLEKLFEEYGLDISTLTFVNLSASEQVAALSTGDIDIMVCWEPFVTNAVQDGAHYLCSGTKNFVADPENGKDVNYGQFYTCLDASEDVIESSPETLEKLCIALNKATDFINDNREEAISILAPIYEMDEDLLAIIMDENDYTTEVNDNFIAGCETVAEYAVEAEVTSKVFTAEDYADWSVLKTALPEKLTVE